jgi:hypothetical protein
MPAKRKKKAVQRTPAYARKEVTANDLDDRVDDYYAKKNADLAAQLGMIDSARVTLKHIGISRKDGVWGRADATALRKMQKSYAKAHRTVMNPNKVEPISKLPGQAKAAKPKEPKKPATGKQRQKAVRKKIGKLHFFDQVRVNLRSEIKESSPEKGNSAFNVLKHVSGGGGFTYRPSYRPESIRKNTAKHLEESYRHVVGAPGAYVTKPGGRIRRAKQIKVDTRER